MSEFTYLPQEVDYLGFLEAQLRDLQGIDRLAYELIQNADDVQPGGDESWPTRLTFDVTDEALIVENDSVFRPIDFQRLQSIAGGGKRDEPHTTGAFGLGFIAVYQVTDAPEILSNGRHWIIQPAAPPDRRIRERAAETSGTRFYLPWATDPASPVRRALRIGSISPEQLDDFARHLAAAIGHAALFLRQLQVLEVRRNGHTVRRLERVTDASRHDESLILRLREADGQSVAWLIFKDDFAGAAARLRQTYRWQIEETRHSNVWLAVPTADMPAQGRLYAVLPTDAAMPLPVHINADFFPTTDRRRIHFEDGYQARWNEQAIACAADILAANLGLLRSALQPTGFWLLLQRALETQQAVERQELPAVFSAFMQSVAPRLARHPFIYSAQAHWLAPPAVRIIEDTQYLPLLEALDVAVVHPQLHAYLDLMRRPEIGVQDLSLQDLRQALEALNMSPGALLIDAPGFLRSLDGWRGLWRLFDALLRPLPRPVQREAVSAELAHLPLAVTDQMSVAALRRVYRGDDETKALFPSVAWLHEALDPDAFPARFVPHFGARQAVEYLRDMSQEQLEEAWRMGRLDTPRLFRWFESHQIEIFADDPALQREIRNLPLVPVSGELRPLAHLYIPGGFEDPLQLAGVADLEAVGGRRQFLQDLGLQQLDFETYVHTHIPRILPQNPDLPSDARHRLLQLLSQRLGQIRDDHELREQLSRLPLIPCMDGSFRPAREVYASREAASLIGPRAHIAEPTESEALAALYRWLGVRRDPSAADLLHAILETSREQLESRRPLTPAALERVRQCWQRLQEYFERKRLPEEILNRLRAARTLPNRVRIMSAPERLLYLDRPDLAAEFTDADLDRYLLLVDDELPSLMAAGGVRPFSGAVTLEVAHRERATAARDIEQRLQERRPLIARLVRAQDTPRPDAVPLRPLRSLRVLQIPELQLRRRLQIGSDVLTTGAERQSAAFIIAEDVLYVDANEERVPWAAIARELAQSLAGDGQSRTTAGLALGIREVLAAPSYDSAAAVLDELGYP